MGLFGFERGAHFAPPRPERMAKFLHVLEPARLDGSQVHGCSSGLRAILDVVPGQAQGSVSGSSNIRMALLRVTLSTSS
jgi:hypothetical protein